MIYMMRDDAGGSTCLRFDEGVEVLGAFSEGEARGEGYERRLGRGLAARKRNQNMVIEFAPCNSMTCNTILCFTYPFDHPFVYHTQRENEILHI